jgi:hypothetical protein
LNVEDKGGLEDVDGFSEVEKDILNIIYACWISGQAWGWCKGLCAKLGQYPYFW